MVVSAPQQVHLNHATPCLMKSLIMIGYISSGNSHRLHIGHCDCFIPALVNLFALSIHALYPSPCGLWVRHIGTLGLAIGYFLLYRPRFFTVIPFVFILKDHHFRLKYSSISLISTSVRGSVGKSFFQVSHSFFVIPMDSIMPIRA